MMKSIQQAELTHDLQAGLGLTVINEFDRLQIIGMASILALHIKGLGSIEYGVLRQVAYHFWSITARDLPVVLKLLAEIEYIDLFTLGDDIKSVIPKIPAFDQVSTGIGGYIDSISLNEAEQLTLSILSELSNKPEKKDALRTRLGAENKLFVGCEKIASESGLVISKRARGQDILVSPAYFADNLDSLADIAAAGGARRVEKILTLIQKAQGWPLSLIESTKEVAGYKVSDDEILILKSLIGDGVLKPPTIKCSASGFSEHFVFTPRPGRIRLNASKRNIYEKAMGLLTSIRKGQLLEEKYKIRYPLLLLSKLKDRKWIGASSEAAIQYRNLVDLHVGRLEHVSGDKYRLRLIDTPENVAAIDEAISLFASGGMTQTAVDEEARIALGQDESYIQSIAASRDFRRINRIELSEDQKQEVEQLLLDLK